MTTKASKLAKLTPAGWEKVLAGTDWRAAYPVVEQHVREWLKHQDQGPISTSLHHNTDELIEGLYPEKLARGDGIYVRQRLYTAVQAMAVNVLADCCFKGPPRFLRHTRKMVRPWVWHRPEPVKCCPSCGQTLPSRLAQSEQPASGAIPNPARCA